MLFDPTRKTKSWQTVCNTDHDHSQHSHIAEQQVGPNASSNSQSAGNNIAPPVILHDHSHDHNHPDHSHHWDMHLINDLIGHGADYLGFLNGVFGKFLYPQLPAWQKITLSGLMIPISLAMARADTRNCAHETHNETRYPDHIKLSTVGYAQLYTNATIEFLQTAIRVFFLIQPLINNSVGQRATQPLIQALINIPLAAIASYVAASTAYCHYSVNWHNAMKKAHEADPYTVISPHASQDSVITPYDQHTPDTWTALALVGFFGNAFASQSTFAVTLINSASLLTDNSLELDFNTLSDPSSVASILLIVSMLIAAAISLAATYCNGVFNLNGQYNQDHYFLATPVTLTTPQQGALYALNATFALGFSATLLLPVITYLDPQDAAIPCIVAGIALTAFGAFGTSSDVASYDRHLQIWKDSFNRQHHTYRPLDEAAPNDSIENGQDNELLKSLFNRPHQNHVK